MITAGCTGRSGDNEIDLLALKVSVGDTEGSVLESEEVCTVGLRVAPCTRATTTTTMNEMILRDRPMCAIACGHDM